MAIIQTQTTVTIGDATAVTTTADLVLQPSVAGSLALRCLVHPTSASFAPITYEKNPDEWTNFDVNPMVKRPRIGVLQTLEDNKFTGWQGFSKDVAITEIWKGSDSEGSMTADFFRQLHAYYENPPLSGFIQWQPKDRTATAYNIVIEALTVNGAQIRFNYLALRNNCLVGDVTLRFRIVSTV
jgi:hypothetical protein